jgi:2-polyprenyl-6-methoxyphenol hydroxylase-like FAD-dependent oxidoreductase
MKILVSGAGIGGLAATLFLRESGHDVVTIDKAPAFSRRGYVLSLKYFGLSIMESLGLHEELQRFGIPFRVIQYRDAKGALVREFSENMAEQATRGTIFLLRPDLHQVLYSAAASKTPVRFGTHITGIDQNNGAATVAFSNGRTEAFDLVVVSEGLHSSSRHLLWDDDGFHGFDIIYAATMIDAVHELPFQVFQFFFCPGATLLFMPLNEKQILLQCYFRGTLQNDHPAQQIGAIVQRRCRHLPQHIRNAMERIVDHKDIFCDTVGMVILPDLTRGRVVMLGDAGYCPTFLSGMGASLALLGAKGLAESLRTEANDVSRALAKYDRLMQPAIVHYQHNALVNMRRMVSSSSLHTLIHSWVLRLFAPTFIVKQMAHEFDLEMPLLRQFGNLGA